MNWNVLSGLLELHRFERRLGGTREHLAGGREPRAVAWAIPCPFGLVPIDVAAHVSARRRHNRQAALVISRSGDTLSVDVKDLALAALHRAQRLALRSRKTIAHQVIGVVAVFLHVIPRAAERGAADAEQLVPG